MARKTTRKQGPRRDVEAEVTGKIIAALERGTVPWHKPWTGGGLFPTSVATGRPYRGINTWLLTLAAAEGGYASPYWMTFKQAQEYGGTVRKGERGTLVVFWKLLKIADDTAEDGVKRVPMMRHYFVFNLEQTDDVKLPPRFSVNEDEREPVVVSEALADVIEGYVDGPTIEHRTSDRAYYMPTTDVVTLPQLDQFEAEGGYAETVLHELVHSTGHASRLGRFAKTGEPQHFGSERYAREELLAEMGAAILAAEHGIEVDFENTAAYVASWLKALRDDKALVIRAAQAAQKAVDRIVGRTFSDATVVETNETETAAERAA